MLALREDTEVVQRRDDALDLRVAGQQELRHFIETIAARRIQIEDPHYIEAVLRPLGGNSSRVVAYRKVPGDPGNVLMVPADQHNSMTRQRRGRNLLHLMPEECEVDGDAASEFVYQRRDGLLRPLASAFLRVLRSVDKIRSSDLRALKRPNGRREKHHQRSGPLPAPDDERLFVLIAIDVNSVRRRIAGRLLRVANQYDFRRGRRDG